MLKTTCLPTYPLVQVLVHFVGPKSQDFDQIRQAVLFFIHNNYNYIYETTMWFNI